MITPVLLLAIQANSRCGVLLERARNAYNAKQYEQAAAGFERAAGVCPSSQALLLNLAQAQLLAQRFEDAKATLDKVLSVEPRNVQALKLKADAQYFSGEDQQAEQTLLRAIGLEPANPEPIYALGRIYYQQSRYEAAAQQFQRVLELDPNSYKAHDNLALAYEGLNENAKAVRHYLRALELVHTNHPEYDWAHGNLANLMLKLGDYRRAFDLAAEAARRNPASARNFFLGGKALSKLDKLDLAEKWLRRSAELDPLYPEPRYLLGQILRKMGRNAEAERELKEFQEISAKAPRSRR